MIMDLAGYTTYLFELTFISLFLTALEKSYHSLVITPANVNEIKH